MHECGFPITNRHHPLFGNVVERQGKQLVDRFLIREKSLGFEYLAERAVERLNRIGGINHLATVRWIVEEGDDVVPVTQPDLGNRGIT